MSLPIGKALKYVRKQSQLSLDGLSIVSGISKPVISRFENGYRVPTFEHLDKLTAAMGINVLKLVKIATKMSLSNLETMNALNIEDKVA